MNWTFNWKIEASDCNTMWSAGRECVLVHSFIHASIENLKTAWGVAPTYSDFYKIQCQLHDNDTTVAKKQIDECGLNCYWEQKSFNQSLKKNWWSGVL